MERCVMMGLLQSRPRGEESQRRTASSDASFLPSPAIQHFLPHACVAAMHRGPPLPILLRCRRRRETSGTRICLMPTSLAREHHSMNSPVCIDSSNGPARSQSYFLIKSVEAQMPERGVVLYLNSAASFGV